MFLKDIIAVFIFFSKSGTGVCLCLSRRESVNFAGRRLVVGAGGSQIQCEKRESKSMGGESGSMKCDGGELFYRRRIFFLLFNIRVSFCELVAQLDDLCIDIWVSEMRQGTAMY